MLEGGYKLKDRTKICTAKKIETFLMIEEQEDKQKEKLEQMRPFISPYNYI